MVGRVAIALLGASPTRDDACFDRGAHQAEVGLGLTGHDPAGRVAHVGAVKIEPNAPHQLGHVRLAEGGVGAARARGRAVEALVDAPQVEVAIEADGPRMPFDDFSNRHVPSFLLGIWVVGSHAAADQQVFGDAEPGLAGREGGSRLRLTR